MLIQAELKNKWKALRQIKVEDRVNAETKAILSYIAIEHPQYQVFLKMLRDVLEGSYYQSHKSDADDVTVATLHQIVVTFWVGEEAFDLYCDLGSKLLQNADNQEESGKSIVQTILKIYPEVEKALQGGWIHQIAKQFSTHVPEFCSTLQGVNKRVQLVKNCYGGIVKGAPEFIALLQAARNDQFAVFYTGYELDTELMSLNSSFPDVFCGITLPKNSIFYCNSNDLPWKGPDAFGEEMLQRLTHGSVNSIMGRQARESLDAGFYFPKQYPIPFEKIIQKVSSRLIKTPDELLLHGRTHDLRGVYQEYVYSMIQAHVETVLAEKRPVIVVRGMDSEFGLLDNFKYLYTVAEKERLHFLVGAFFRELLVSPDHLISLDKTSQVFAFLKFVDLKLLREDLGLAYS